MKLVDNYYGVYLKKIIRRERSCDLYGSKIQTLSCKYKYSQEFILL